MSRICSLVCQSNGLGRWVRGGASNYQHNTVGPPHQDPIGPNSGDGSMWPGLAAATNTVFRNTSVSGTSIVEDWCGGIGGVPYERGDVGFDPNGYLATALSEAQAGIFTERCVFIMLGARDSLQGITGTNFGLGYQYAAEYFLANGVNQVVMNLTTYRRDIGDLTALYSAYSAAVDEAVSSVTGAVKGIDLYKSLGVNVGLQSDQLHWSENTYYQVIALAFNALPWA